MMPGADALHAMTIATGTSLVGAVLIVLTKKLHGKLTLDSDTSGVQKFHKVPVPRIGGVAVLVGIFAAVVFRSATSSAGAESQDIDRLFLLLLAGLPAFFAGSIEDLTKKVAVKVRLGATICSALLACWLVGASLPRVDVWGVDAVFEAVPIAAAAFTVFAVAGVANSINIIDGFHGVAASTVVILLAAMGFLAWTVGDEFVVTLALVGAGAAIGFFLVNFPAGRLFMGDGGAYLLGFWVAEVAVLLIVRNPSISAWQVLGICAYPIIEVLYSIYRKKVIRKMSPGIPDGLHLHMLIYRRLVWKFLPRDDRHPWVRNAAVSCVTAPSNILVVMAALAIGDEMPVLLVLAEVVLYVAAYTRLVRGHWRFNPILALGLRPEPAVREAP